MKPPNLKLFSNVILLFLINIILIFLTPCSKKITSSSAPLPDNPDPNALPSLAVSELQTALNVFYSEHDNILGTIAYIEYPGYQPWKGRCGKFDLGGPPLKVNDLFPIGSITKTFTATIIMQLIEEGKVDLHESFTLYIPNFYHESFFMNEFDQITIYQLLSHRSGIFNYLGPLWANLEYADRDYVWTPGELIQFAADYGQLQFEPGSEYRYSNTNYIILGVIIEHICQKPLKEVYLERIFNIIGLENTYMNGYENVPNRIIHGYAGQHDVTEYHFSHGWAAGALVSTAEDLGIFISALRMGEFFEDPATLDLMLNSEEDTNYGLGLINWENDGRIGHTGGIMGHLAYMIYDSNFNATFCGAITFSSNVNLRGSFFDLFNSFSAHLP